MQSRQQSLSDRVQCELERLILRGELRPGEHVKEQALATSLGVSRNPVREACRALERAGLVAIIPHRGVFVREVSLQEATDVFDIRAEMSGIVAREAVRNVSPKALDALSDLIRRMDEAAIENDADAHLELNLKFHAALYRLADNKRIAELDRSLGNELLVYRRRGVASGGGLGSSNQEHKGILAALAAGDADEMAKRLKSHISAGKDRFLLAMGLVQQDIKRNN
jgi:DNA-binding GntR family transcriptional regulator